MELSLLELAALADHPLEFAIFLADEGYIRKEKPCIRETCDGTMRFAILSRQTDGFCHRCDRCRCWDSVKIGTFFEDSHLSIHQILAIAHCFQSSMSIVDASVATGSHRNTVSKFYKRFRTKIHESLQDHPIEWDGDCIYEADETYIGHVDAGNGTFIEQLWIAGFLNRATGALAVYTVANRTAAVLQQPIRANVPPNSIICTDSHPSYVSLGNEYIHRSVNHSAGEYSRHDYIEGWGQVVVHCNNMEEIWRELKRLMANKSCCNLTFLDEYCEELVFKRAHRTIFNLIKTYG